jgi:hypothetical protein
MLFLKSKLQNGSVWQASDSTQKIGLAFSEASPLKCRHGGNPIWQLPKTRQKWRCAAVKLFPQLKAGEITLTDLAVKVTGRKPGTGMNFTRTLLVKSCAEAKAHFARSAKRYGKAKAS